jgi:hypothetical protein
MLHDTWIAACVVDANFQRHETYDVAVWRNPSSLYRGCVFHTLNCVRDWTVCKKVFELSRRPVSTLRLSSSSKTIRSVTEHKSRSNSTPASIKVVTPFLETGNFSQLFLSPCHPFCCMKSIKYRLAVLIFVIGVLSSVFTLLTASASFTFAATKPQTMPTRWLTIRYL